MKRRDSGQTEGMEDGQGIEHLVVDREINHRANLRDVGQNSAMRQHDSLRLALRTGGKEHNRSLFRRSLQFKGTRKMNGVEHEP